MPNSISNKRGFYDDPPPAASSAQNKQQNSSDEVRKEQSNANKAQSQRLDNFHKQIRNKNSTSHFFLVPIPTVAGSVVFGINFL